MVDQNTIDALKQEIEVQGAIIHEALAQKVYHKDGMVAAETRRTVASNYVRSLQAVVDVIETHERGEG